MNDETADDRMYLEREEEQRDRFEFSRNMRCYGVPYDPYADNEEEEHDDE